jgi:hypothetical protein
MRAPERGITSSCHILHNPTDVSSVVLKACRRFSKVGFDFRNGVQPGGELKITEDY